MDKITYLEFLDNMTSRQLEDYLESIWKEDIEINEAYEKWLTEYLDEKKREKAARYVKIFLLLLALLAAVPAYEGPIRRIVKAVSAPIFDDDYEYVWVTEDDDKVCPICKALDGKIIGPNVVAMGIKTHPGCRCKIVKRLKAGRGMNIRTLEAGAVRAVKDGKKRILEVLAAPFGSSTRKDKLGQFLSPNTDFMIGLGDKRPLLYFHGFTPRAKAMKQPFSIGTAEATKVDGKGLWMRAELGDDELSDRTWEAALEGTARASTGSVNYLERHDDVTGEVYCWPIAELSVFDGSDERVPVSDDAVVLPLRALYNEIGIQLPEHFEAGEDKRTQEIKSKQELGVMKMNEDIKAAVEAALIEKEAEKKAQEDMKEALRAEIKEEMKGEAKYRSTFNINKIQGDKGLEPEKLETFSFVRGLIEDARTVAAGGIPARASDLPLLETDAEELQMMVPEDMYNQVHDLLSAYSLPDKLNSMGLLPIYKTDKLIFNVPAEETALAAQADIAEGGAYTANTPEFVNFAITMQKVGSYVSVSEEALEDQDLFQQWLVRAVARSVALSKNVDFAGLLSAVAGTQIATTDVITDAELIAAYYGLDQEYRDKSCWFMNDSTLAYVRAMLILTPRAYGEFGFAPMSMGEVGERLMNKPVFTNANWEATVGGTDGVPGVTHVNLHEAMFWVERRKMSIFVDPYSTKLSAGTVNFLPSARYGGVIVNAAGIYNIDNNTE